MSAIPNEVKTDISTAKTKRNLRQFSQGLTAITNAINSLKKELEMVADSAADVREELQAKLADCFGIKGGIYRYWARDILKKARTNEEKAEANRKLIESLQMYEEGLRYEEPLGKDSYNLSNVIAVKLTLDGTLLPNLLPDISNSIELVDGQINHGGRGGQWWARADLAMFNLLCGNLKDAKEQYREFRKCGARDEDYKSVMEVLRELQESLKISESSAADPIAQAIDFLDRERGSNHQTS